jgi:RNA polymerase sigma-70 factor (ECF subfamily)
LVRLLLRSVQVEEPLQAPATKKAAKAAGPHHGVPSSPEAKALTPVRAHAGSPTQRNTSYQSGTNLRAWIYLILRNKFYSDTRRAWRSTSLSPEVAEATLAARDNVECILELDEVRRALPRLTDQHREALILVGVGGFSYDEAADILKVPAGTVKSRVYRARVSLAGLVAAGDPGRDGAPAGEAFEAIVNQLDVHPSGRELGATRDWAA